MLFRQDWGESELSQTLKLLRATCFVLRCQKKTLEAVLKKQRGGYTDSRFRARE